MDRPDWAPDAGAPADLADVTRAWAAGLAASCYVPMSRAECAEFLRLQAQRLIEALRAEPFHTNPGYQVGVDLVGADLASPQALGRTIEVIGERLLPVLFRPPEDAGARLSRLIAALATGYAWAMRDRTLDEQEAIRVAALTARAEAARVLREGEARFRHAALHDSLTGLPNRLRFEQWLHELAARPGQLRLGVCSIGLDRFQRVNDSLGPRVGDRLLVAVAGRLSELAAESGHRLARVGGDEFNLLIEGRSATVADGAGTGPVGSQELTKVADQVVAALTAPFRIDGHDLPVSASVGLADVPSGDPIEIMGAADIARQWARDDGGAGWRLFEAGRSARDVARFQLSAAMPAALDRDEFILVYQPLVRLRDGVPVGVEALARWRHPELGLLGADEFIDLAEHTGLIVSLGLRLLDRACQQAAAWAAPAEVAAGDPPTRSWAGVVSVNLAARQIGRPGLVGSVAEILDRHRLDPGRLQLEITESAVLGTDRDTLDVLHGLADLGVGLVLDDFGTGYANLAGLDTLPLHGLKLAAQFVASPGGRTASRHHALLAGVVSLARNLGLTVTAEGIETAAQATRLGQMGCEIGQGWYFGRPQPAEQSVGVLCQDRLPGADRMPAAPDQI
jgi:diguanylate cyclase